MTQLTQQDYEPMVLDAAGKLPTCGGDDDGNALNIPEVEIMEWVARGKSNSEIVDLLNVSPFTVKSHMQRIFHKLDVFSRAQAIDAFTRNKVMVGATQFMATDSFKSPLWVSTKPQPVTK